VGPTQTGHATIEVMSWVTRFVGGDGSGRREYAEPVGPGETVRAVLKRFSARHPELDRALWDSAKGDLGEHIEVLVNDAVLGVSHTLDSPLRPGDRISLVGQFMGG
jgi:molybdopterin converting factor small subunit